MGKRSDSRHDRLWAAFISRCWPTKIWRPSGGIGLSPSRVGVFVRFFHGFLRGLEGAEALCTALILCYLLAMMANKKGTGPRGGTYKVQVQRISGIASYRSP